MTVILELLCLALTIYWVILIVRIILSWVPNVPEPVQPLARAVRTVTDPVLRPVRGLLPPVRLGMAALDLSPIIVFIAIGLIRGVLCTPGGGV